MGIDVANGPFPTLPLPCDCSGRGLASPTTAVAGNLICLDKVFFSSERKWDIILLLVVDGILYCS